jgi:hypothetical protein
MFAAHTSTACSVGHSESAVRPLGNVTRAVSTYGGAPFGSRLAKNDSPSMPSG